MPLAICAECKNERQVAADRKICAGCRSFHRNIKSGVIREPDYPETNIANYKEPMQKVEDGFGYYGAVTETNDGRHIQCHICGYFFGNLGAHVSKKHNVRAVVYKQTYGLRIFGGLLSPVVRKNAQDAYNRTNRKSPEDYAEMSRKAREVQKEKGYKPGGNTWAAQTRNEKGKCREQTLAKIKYVASLNGGTPTRKLLSSQYGHGEIYTVRYWFGTWENAIREAGCTNQAESHQKRRKDLREQTLVAMKAFYEAHKRTPLSSDFNVENNLVSSSTVGRMFGSLNKARVEAGIPELVFWKKQWIEV